jgi:hypothetical protein
MPSGDDIPMRRNIVTQAFRNAAKACGADPVLVRAASSAKVTSRM